MIGRAAFVAMGTESSQQAPLIFLQAYHTFFSAIHFLPASSRGLDSTRRLFVYNRTCRIYINRSSKKRKGVLSTRILMETGGKIRRLTSGSSCIRVDYGLARQSVESARGGKCGSRGPFEPSLAGYLLVCCRGCPSSRDSETAASETGLSRGSACVHGGA